eukprot:185208_1
MAMNKENQTKLPKKEEEKINHVNINKICFCGKLMKRCLIEDKKRHCYCCCKRIFDKIIYKCQRLQQCEHYVSVGKHYKICCECFNALDNDSNITENKDNLEVRKIESSIKIINTQIKQCKNNQQKRTYLVNIYHWMYRDLIRKLNNEMLSHTFNTFYNKHAD